MFLVVEALVCVWLMVFYPISIVDLDEDGAWVRCCRLGEDDDGWATILLPDIWVRLDVGNRWWGKR